jgi:23S rRNA pseudouridine2605 synthase
VNRLIRVSFGPFQLLDLEPGAVEPVKRRVLIDQLGSKVAADLGLSDEEDAQARARWAKSGSSRSKTAAKPKGGS